MSFKKIFFEYKDKDKDKDVNQDFLKAGILEGKLKRVQPRGGWKVSGREKWPEMRFSNSVPGQGG